MIKSYIFSLLFALLLVTVKCQDDDSEGENYCFTTELVLLLYNNLLYYHCNSIITADLTKFKSTLNIFCTTNYVLIFISLKQGG